jgi:NADH:ubiquinone oxidoreductase subunit D
MDVGALTPFLWASEEREKLMNFMKEYRCKNAYSIHTSCGVALDLP